MKIKSLAGIDVEKQRLVFLDSELKDDWKLDDHGLYYSTVLFFERLIYLFL
jgi:hypothetical protein